MPPRTPYLPVAPPEPFAFLSFPPLETQHRAARNQHGSPDHYRDHIRVAYQHTICSTPTNYAWILDHLTSDPSVQAILKAGRRARKVKLDIEAFYNLDID